MTKISKHKALAGIALAAASVGWVTPASAQAPRTWVAHNGDDANPCSRTAPCKTFAGAISKTAPGGEINCVDAASYGAVTITKSISIVCQYTEAGVLSMFGSSGIIINAAATDVIYLRGLDINGANHTSPGLHGIRVINGGFVHIEDTLIRNYRSVGSQGINIAPASAVQVTVTNTTVADNGNGAGSGGIVIRPPAGMAGANGSARVTLRDVRIQNNVGHQVGIDTTDNNGQGVTLFVEESQLLGGTNGIAVIAPTNNANVTAMVVDSFIARSAAAPGSPPPAPMPGCGCGRARSPPGRPASPRPAARSSTPTATTAPTATARRAPSRCRRFRKPDRYRRGGGRSPPPSLRERLIRRSRHGNSSFAGGAR